MRSALKHPFFSSLLSGQKDVDGKQIAKFESTDLIHMTQRLDLANGIIKTAVVTLMLAISLIAGAQTHQIADSATIFFPLSHSEISPSLRGNTAELERITNFIHHYNDPDSGYTLHSIRVVGGASPEGSVEINERLSQQRASSIFDYVLQGEAIPDSAVTYIILGRDWNGLRRLVTDDAQVPYRTEVLELLNKIIADGDDNTIALNRNIAKLHKLHGGLPYRYMFTNLFPELRASKLLVEYEYPALPDVVTPELSIDSIVADETTYEIIEVLPVIESDTTICRKPLYMSLKTNMLYDAVALPSAGAEFYVGKNWSLGINWTYGWWSNDKRHRYWRAYGGDINVRRWFGRKAEEKPLTGHHIGLYGGIVTYDFEFGGKGYMGGLPHRTLWDRCNYTGGIEYGYSVPISRRLNIDFTIGIGYMGGKYLEYVPKGNHYEWQRTMHLQWFGPTKAEVSLVWLIGSDNYNPIRKKGGNL